mgnify:FL=1
MEVYVFNFLQCTASSSEHLLCLFHTLAHLQVLAFLLLDGCVLLAEIPLMNLYITYDGIVELGKLHEERSHLEILAGEFELL